MLEVSEIKQMELSDYIDIKQEIRNKLSNVVVSFVQIGYYLKKVNADSMYKEDGYKDIWEFAKMEYNLDRTAASRFMSINDRYSVDGNSIELQEEYRGLSKSALVEMLTLPVEDYELITPETKISDIRELKQEEQKQADEQLEGQESIMSLMPEVVPDSEKPKTEVTIHDVIRDLFHSEDMKDILNRLVSADPNEKSFEYIIEELNPSGNRVAKKIPYFIFFYKFKDGIKVKNVVANVIMNMTYKEFYFEVRGAFHKECVDNPSDVWSAAYKKYKSDDAANENAEKTEVKNAESIDSIPTESDFEEPEKVPETTEIRSEESESESDQPKEEPKTPENESKKIAGKPDFIPTEPDSEVDNNPVVVEGDIEDMSCSTCEESPLKLGNGERCKHCALNPIEDEGMCDIAQNNIGWNVSMIYKPCTCVYIVSPIDHTLLRNTYQITEYDVFSIEFSNPVFYSVTLEQTGEYGDETRHLDIQFNVTKECAQMRFYKENKEYIEFTREEAEKRCAELNGEA